MRFFSVALFILTLPTATISAAPALDLTPVKKWIARQDDLRTVQADFVQTRALRALRSPVAVPGRIAFRAPDSLRWELGDPAKTIVLRKDDTYLIIQPAKKKAERVAAEDMDKKGAAKGLAMMKFPLAKDFADFNRQFEVLAISTTENRCHLEVLPRDPQAGKFLTAIRIDFDMATSHLIAFEMAFRDGSSMRNEFSNVRMNQKLPPHTFDFDLTGYELADAKQ